MNKTTWRVSMSVVGFIVSLFIVSPVYAGGGLVSFSVSPSYSQNPGEEYIIRPTVYTGGSQSTFANGYPIKVVFENPQPSDYIAQSGLVTNKDGQMYAKVISYIPGVRMVYVDVTLPNGVIYKSSDYVLNYTTPQPSVTPTPIPLPTPTIKPTPLPTPDVSPSVTPMPTPSNLPSSTPYPTPDLYEKALMGRVDMLQQQENQTNSHLSILSQIVNQIVSFLRSIFPFFK